MELPFGTVVAVTIPLGKLPAVNERRKQNNVCMPSSLSSSVLSTELFNQHACVCVSESVCLTDRKSVCV